jgi:hypothetical protein
MAPTLLLVLLTGCVCPDGLAGRHGPADGPSPTDSTPGDSDPADTGTHDTDDTDDTGGNDPGSFPARYPADRLQSPLTPWVRDRLVALRDGAPGLHDDVFMKVGDSITVDSNALGCFAGSRVDLGARPDLQPTIDHFLAGEAGGGSPWERDSRAAEVGQTAAWAMSGDPSPVERELDALSPAFAVVQYGTNDIHMGSTYLSAIWSFGESMLDLTDLLIDEGVIPLLVTIPPRADSTAVDAWVPTYNAVVRGIAQGRQVPLVDLELGLRPLDDYGLYGDGVHLEPYGQGACQLTDAGLEYGCNVRNLLVLDGLDRLRRAALDGEVFDDDGEPLAGSGLAADPFVIDSLPFTDLRDTSLEGERQLDSYPGCGSSADESGPELVYRFDLERRTTLRFLVFDRGQVDIDLHVLGATVDDSDCQGRDDSDLELTLDSGTWHLVLDTYVSGGQELSGEFLVVVIEA